METGGPICINSEALKDVIRGNGCTLTNIATNLGIQTRTLTEKIEGKRDFWWHEIIILNRMLRLTPEEFHKIFGP